MKKIIALMLAICCLGGCTFTENQVGEIVPDKQEEQFVRKDTDCVNIALSEGFNFQPHSVKSENTKSALGFIYEPLYTFDENMTPIPVLAQNTEKNGKSVTVILKKNVMFHDGSAMTASDVVYSINLILSKASTYFAENIASVKEKDKSKVVIELKHAMACPEELLTFPIVKNKSPQTMDKPNGTGPFAFYAEQGFDTYVFKIFDGYHGEKPKFSTLKLVSCSGDEQLKQMFDIGETDIITADNVMLSSFTPRINSEINSYLMPNMVYIGFNNSRIPKSIRRAVYLTLKKKEICEKCFSHSGEYTDYPIIPSYISPQGGVRNSEAAEFEMKNDGYELKDGMFVKGGAKAVLNFMLESDEYMPLFEEISEELKIFGIECRNVQTNFYYDKLSSFDYDVCLGSSYVSTDMTCLLGEGNPFLYENSDFNALASYDKENIMQAIKIFEEDVPIVPICFKKSAVSYGNKISEITSPCYAYPYYGFGGWVLK